MLTHSDRHGSIGFSLSSAFIAFLYASFKALFSQLIYSLHIISIASFISIPFTPFHFNQIHSTSRHTNPHRVNSCHIDSHHVVSLLIDYDDINLPIIWFHRIKV